MKPSDYVFQTEPYDFQRDVFLKSAQEPYWAYFLEQGLGKTKVLLDNSAYLCEIGVIEGLILFTIKAMLPTMEMIEVPTHFPERIKYKVFRYDSRKSKNKSFQVEWQLFLKFPGFKIFLLNTEAVISVTAQKMLAQFQAVVGINYMVGVDEATMVKSHEAKRSIQVVKVAKKAKFKRILTGTPTAGGPLDLWGQVLVLGDPVRLLGHKSFYSFRGYFCEVERKILGTRTFVSITGYQNMDELSKEISAWSSIIKKVDALDLPEKIYSRILVELTAEQKRMYDKLNQEAILELEDMGDSVEVTNVLTLLVKVHQVVCGQIKYPDPVNPERTKYASIDNNRIPALIDLLSVETGKVIIWANYRKSISDIIEAIKNEFGDDSVIDYYGGTKDVDKKTAAKRFQDLANPGRFFVGNPQSAGLGLTLTAADLSIYYSNSYSLEKRLQSEDRNHRIGQTRKVRYIDMVTPNTVDEKILKALKNKKNLSDTITKFNWRRLFE